MHKWLFIYKDGQSWDKACTTYASWKFFDDGLAIKVYEGDEVSTFEQKNGFTWKIVPDPELKGAICPTGANEIDGSIVERFKSILNPDDLSVNSAIFTRSQIEDLLNQSQLYLEIFNDTAEKCLAAIDKRNGTNGKEYK